MLSSCTKSIDQQVVYDNVIYGLDTVEVYSSAAEKTKQKTPTQFYSILYGDLFQTSIPGKELNDLGILSQSIGDKQVMNEMVLASYINNLNVKVPSSVEMRADIGKFIDNTYIRFYLRKPTPSEKYYLVNLITTDTGITPSIVYSAFSLSNEYLFY